jgi:hypothetical protein
MKKTDVEAHINFLKRCEDRDLIQKDFVTKQSKNSHHNKMIRYDTMIQMVIDRLLWRCKPEG